MIQNVQILAQNEPFWQDKQWKKLLSSAISDPVELLSLLDLAPDQLPYEIDPTQKFKQLVPKPFVERMAKGEPNDPLLLQVLPLAKENVEIQGFSSDPLNESAALSKTGMAGLLHKYQSRVLFMLASHCAINCRYCFRREFPYAENRASKQNWQQLAEYLEANPEINEVIISGGDPLAVNDRYLTDFVRFIEQIPQIIRLRIHSRLPIVIPQRVTQPLLNLVQSRLQLVMVVHTNHPNEIDSQVSIALNQLSQAGYQVFNQSVLLNGINDDVETLAQLSEKLFANKVSPYYLHVLDKVSGTAHFEVAEQDAKLLIKQLQAKLAGFLVPKLVREIAGEPNKTPLHLTI
ncbi:MAG: EF-P beta-lysylation protein EpmB [Gammaproteobacteria bacterium]|nr:EF-P beta-lysylation protein EpmB [Gammaproteobacteria bacterium]